jgi:hypothetical protein
MLCSLFPGLSHDRGGALEHSINNGMWEYDAVAFTVRVHPLTEEQPRSVRHVSQELEVEVGVAGKGISRVDNTFAEHDAGQPGHFVNLPLRFLQLAVRPRQLLFHFRFLSSASRCHIDLLRRVP